MGGDMFDDYVGDFGTPRQPSPLVSPVKLSITKLADQIRINVSNQGENIIIIKRIILVLEYGPTHTAGFSFWKDDFYAGEEIEEGLARLFVIHYGDFSGITKARCTADYVEVSGHVSSKVYNY